MHKMSKGMISTPVTNIAAVPQGKQSSSNTVARLDEQLHCLSDTILPPYPYLLSVPSDVPYRHSSRFVNTWYEGTPFDPQEEQLQYLSFLPRQGDHESLLKVEGGWADDRGNPVEEEELSPTALPASGRHTPVDVGARKKISLKDYKTKAKSPSGTTPRIEPPKTAVKPLLPPLEPVKVTKNIPQPIIEKKQEGQPVPAKTNDVEENPLKVSSMEAPKSPKVDVKIHHADSPSPAKRRKLSPPFEGPRPVTNPSKTEPDSSVTKMSRLLSPTLPSPEKATGLPQLLSPLLPPSLAKELSPSPHNISFGSPATTPTKRSDPVRAILAGADLDNRQAGERKGLTPAGNRVRSDSQHSAKSSGPGTPNATKVAMGAKLTGLNGIKAGTPLHNGVRASPGPRQRHTIILKYGKKNRKRVEALLKFASRTKKDALKAEAAESRSTSDIQSRKATVKKEILDVYPPEGSKPKVVPVGDAKPEKKRKAEDSPGASMKKVKAAEAEKRPTTPVPPAGKTPLSSQPRSTFSTPKKEFRSTAMRRVESTDGGDAPTPTGDKGPVSTPQAAPKPSPQPPSGSNSSRQEERQQWTTLNEKFFKLGRELKHEGTAKLPREGDPKSPKAVLLVIDALLCFMINIAAQSQARPNVDPGWRSIILYHIFVFRAWRSFPHLHALVVQLGAVCRQLVHKHDLDRLARDPLPEDYCNSAPTPGSDGNTRTNEDGETYKTRYVEFRNELVSNARELQIAWLDSSRQLPLEVLKREYPSTWSKRAKDPMARLQDKPTPSKIPKCFYLPLDANTTAFEAARFGAALLEEWADRERVDWTTRIEL